MATPSYHCEHPVLSSASLSAHDATTKRIFAAIPDHNSLSNSIKETIWTMHALHDSKAAATVISGRLRIAQDELLRLSMTRTRRASVNDREQQHATAAPRSLVKRITGRVGRRKSSVSGADDAATNASQANAQADHAFLQLLQTERASEQRVSILRAELDEAELEVATNAVGAEQHQSYLKQLEALYDDAFDPSAVTFSAPASNDTKSGELATSSGFSEEEFAAAAVRKASSPTSRLHGDIASETLVLSHLRAAATEVADALHSARAANRWSKVADVPFVIGSNIVAGAGQNSSLDSAAEKLCRARLRTEDAREVQPSVIPLTFADVERARETTHTGPRPHALAEGALFRGNVGTLQPTVELMLDRILKSQRVIDREQERARTRKRKLEKELRAVQREVAEKKRALRIVRAEIFKQVAGVEVQLHDAALGEEEIELPESPLSEATLDAEDETEAHVETMRVVAVAPPSFADTIGDESALHSHAEQLPQYSLRAAS